MGIGGLDAEFSAIFRRAFASRIFPPGLIDKLGIQHVKGSSLFLFFTPVPPLAHFFFCFVQHSDIDSLIRSCRKEYCFTDLRELEKLLWLDRLGKC